MFLNHFLFCLTKIIFSVIELTFKMEGFIDEPQYIPQEQSFLVRIPGNIYERILKNEVMAKQLSKTKYQLIDIEGNLICTIIANDEIKEQNPKFPLDTIVKGCDGMYVPIIKNFQDDSTFKSNIKQKTYSIDTHVVKKKTVLTSKQLKEEMILRFDSKKDLENLQSVRRKFDESSNKVTNILKKIKYRIQNSIDIDSNTLIDALNAIQANENDLKRCIEDIGN